MPSAKIASRPLARLPRFVLPGHPQHVIVRGNNRDPIFNADEDYRFYLDTLQKAAKKHSCGIHAYVLMTHDQWGHRSMGSDSIDRFGDPTNPPAWIGFCT